MSETSPSADSPCGVTGRTPEQISALLFSLLAKFLVWGQQHRDVAATYPDFDCLLENAETALAEGGIVDQPAGSILPCSSSPHAGLDSNTLISEAFLSIPCPNCGETTEQRIARLRTCPEIVCAICGTTVRVDINWGEFKKAIKVLKKMLDDSRT